MLQSILVHKQPSRTTDGQNCIHSVVNRSVGFLIVASIAGFCGMCCLLVNTAVARVLLQKPNILISSIERTPKVGSTNVGDFKVLLIGLICFLLSLKSYYSFLTILSTWSVEKLRQLRRLQQKQQKAKQQATQTTPQQPPMPSNVDKEATEEI